MQNVTQACSLQLSTISSRTRLGKRVNKSKGMAKKSCQAKDPCAPPKSDLMSISDLFGWRKMGNLGWSDLPVPGTAYYIAGLLSE